MCVCVCVCNFFPPAALVCGKGGGAGFRHNVIQASRHTYTHTQKLVAERDQGAGEKKTREDVTEARL